MIFVNNFPIVSKFSTCMHFYLQFWATLISFWACDGAHNLWINLVRVALKVF